jgi:hypothetical protein
MYIHNAKLLPYVDLLFTTLIVQTKIGDQVFFILHPLNPLPLSQGMTLYTPEKPARFSNQDLQSIHPHLNTMIYCVMASSLGLLLKQQPYTTTS